MTILYNNDLSRDALASRRVCVLGFGAQGRAQALNLRDSGIDVVVGLREGSSRRAAALAEGLAVEEPADAIRSSHVVVVLVPDVAQPEVYRDVIAPSLREGGCLVFAHGFAIQYGRIEPRADLDVVMVAPMGIGEQVRAIYARGAGVPALLAVHQDATGEAMSIAQSYATANGHGHAGVIMSSFAEETETDLFAEQAVLCGGLHHLVTMAFETLVEAGYQPEVAYFCCLHEVRYMAEMMQRRGISRVRESISDIAEYGDYTRGPRVIGEESRAAMRAALAEIRDGRFTRELDARVNDVLPEGRRQAREHLLEEVGAKLRAGMPWLDED
ncbi:MAG TPA: ketol-acid reductoisomerase [Gammaproteobacteria bacterium]|nr:ketol-acid reductoisomerase [Gammaproteobacteria bacterium]